jgi:hypothetical protein
LGQLANNEENEQDGFVLTVILLAILIYKFMYKFRIKI